MPPRREKFYCGLKQILPDGYARFGLPFECMKKGYGACLYAGKLGTGTDALALVPPPIRRNWLWIMIIVLLLLVILSLIWYFYRIRS